MSYAISASQWVSGAFSSSRFWASRAVSSVHTFLCSVPSHYRSEWGQATIGNSRGEMALRAGLGGLGGYGASLLFGVHPLTSIALGALGMVFVLHDCSPLHEEDRKFIEERRQQRAKALPVPLHRQEIVPRKLEVKPSVQTLSQKKEGGVFSEEELKELSRIAGVN